MTEPIRVLQVFAQMNRGGAETMIMNLYRNIDRRKIQFDFMVHTDEKCAFDDEITQLGGKIYRVPRYNGKNHFSYKKAWNHFFKYHLDYKVIHGHVRSTASIYLGIAKKCRLCAIAHSHSVSSGKGISALIKNVFQLPLKYSADYLFACSMEAGEWLYGKKAVKKDNFFIIKNAIIAEDFFFNQEIRDEIRKDLKVENKFVIGHVGRFNEPKNHSFLIDIFKFIVEKNENSILLLVGDGLLRQDIENKIKDYGLTDKVILLGTREDVSRLYQAMDVFVFPSMYEGLGIALIEAQATGLMSYASLSAVPDETRISNLVKYIPLSESAKFWADNIIKDNHFYNRVNTHEVLEQSGYDIKQSVKWIEEFYLKVSKSHG